MKTYNFYFTRHGQSYANIYDKKIIDNILDLDLWEAFNNFQKKIEKDPHLTDNGIINTLKAKNIINIFSMMPKFDYAFVSPLIRTYETALLMFNQREYIIGPYLKETPYLDLPLFNDDKATNYDILITRINRFKKYVSKFIKYKKIYDNIINTRLIRLENYDNTINKYTDNGDLEKFIEWFINQYNKVSNAESNILVVCHNNLIKTLIKNNNNNIYNKGVFENNNYILKVQVICDENIIIDKMEFIFNGINVK